MLSFAGFDLAGFDLAATGAGRRTECPVFLPGRGPRGGREGAGRGAARGRVKPGKHPIFAIGGSPWVP